MPKECWNCHAQAQPAPKKEKFPPKCKLCEVLVHDFNMKAHKQTETHKLRQELFDKLPLMTKTNLEFVLMNPLAVGEQEKQQ